MSFYTKIYTVMSADSSLNSYADGIYGKRRIDTIDEENKTIIVFDYSKEDSVSGSDDKDYLSYWKLYVYVGSKDINKVFNITERVQSYLEAYSDSNILMIKYNSDNQSYDNELQIFYNDIEFTVVYQN